MIIELWQGESEEEIAGANSFFYPNSGVYRGNLFNEDGRMIGDFTSTGSVEIEDRFPGIFDD